MLDDFLCLSEALTGFDAYHLQGTGLAQTYLDTAVRIAGEDTMADLLKAWGCAQHYAEGAADEMAAELRHRILGDPRLGPVARNVIKMWYVGTWYALPREWQDTYGGPDAGTASFVVSPEAYTEGLLWPAVGANPSGAKPFGYGMWALPPRVLPAQSR